MYKVTEREQWLEDNDKIVAENEWLIVFNQLFEQMSETYKRTGGAKVYNDKALALKKRLAEIKALRSNK